MYYIQLSESLPYQWIWEDAEKLKWWLDLLFLAKREKCKVEYRNHSVSLQAGELCASLADLSTRWGRSVPTIISFLNLLKQHSMIKRSTLNSQIPIIHICDYEKYLHIDKVGAEVNVAIVQNIPTDSTAKHKYAPLVLLTEQEYHKLIETYTQEGTDWMIKKLDDYKAARGMTYKSDYRAILNWVVKEYEKYKQYGNHRSGYNDKRQRIESNASSAEDYEGAF